MSDPVKFLESTENSLKIHLAEWKDSNCVTDTFIVEHRWGDVKEEGKPWRFINHVPA